MFIDNKKQWPKGVLEINTQRNGSHGNLGDLFVSAYRCTSFITMTNNFNITFCYFGICFISVRFFQGDKLYFYMFLSILSEVIGILLTMIFLDRAGRKLTMSIGWFASSIVCLVIIEIPRDKDGERYPGLDLMCILLARGLLLPTSIVLTIYTAEYYPTVIRSTAVGFGFSISRIGGLATMIVAENFKKATAMFIFSVVSFISLLLTIMLPQDTAGLALKHQIGECVGKIGRSSSSENVSEGKNVDTIRELPGGEETET